MKIKASLWVASFITALIIPLFLFDHLVFNISYYKDQFQKLGIYYKEQEADEITYEILQYFKGKAEIVTQKLTHAEKSHLADVKKIFNTIKIIMYFLIGLLLFLFFIVIKRLKTRKEIKEFLAYYFIISGIILLSMILMLSIALLNFHSAFQGMHEILFPQGNYIFPEDFTLVTLFPEQFFMNFVTQIIINNIIIAFFLLVLGYITQS